MGIDLISSFNAISLDHKLPLRIFSK